MAHQISFVSGRAEIAYSGETPWHGLGTKVDGLQTATAMLAAAGIAWTVGTFPLFCNSNEVEGWKAIVRNDSMSVLGVVSDRYEPIQNAQAADMMDALILEGGAHVEVAGALGNGERCWMLARLPESYEVVKGDEVRPYVLQAWGHDGKHGLADKLTNVRVVCNNTLTAAGFGNGKWSAAADVYVKHNGKAAVNIAEARKALGLIRKQVELTAEAYRFLAKPITPAQFVGYVNGLFPYPTVTADPTQADIAQALATGDTLGDISRLMGGASEIHAPSSAAQADGRRLLGTDSADLAAARKRIDGIRLAVHERMEKGHGAEIPGVRGTAWGAYNAVTEWADHIYPVLQSGHVSKVRQESVAFGGYADLKRRALVAGLEMAGA